MLNVVVVNERVPPETSISSPVPVVELEREISGTLLRGMFCIVLPEDENVPVPMFKGDCESVIPLPRFALIVTVVNENVPVDPMETKTAFVSVRDTASVERARVPVDRVKRGLRVKEMVESVCETPVTVRELSVTAVVVDSEL